MLDPQFRLYSTLTHQSESFTKSTIRTLVDDKVYVSMISFTMRCRFSIDPELRKIQSNDLVVYDVELSEFISRKLIRLKTESPEPIFTNRLHVHFEWRDK
ncbi:MAG TPA: hypothetical protein VGE40_04175 [Bacilli bacterium]